RSPPRSRLFPYTTLFRSKTEPLVRVGMMEKLELDQLSVQVNSLSNAVRSAERQYEMAKNMLRIQLGVTAETEIELTDKLVDMIEDRKSTRLNSSHVKISY